MDDVSVVALFCDDIREETSGQNTIVGVLPDNIMIPQLPAALPKIAIYVRIHLKTSSNPQSISTRFVAADGTVISRNDVDQKLIQSTLGDARKDHAPHFGIISRFMITPFAVKEPGRMLVVTTVDGKDYIAGTLNVRPPAST